MASGPSKGFVPGADPASSTLSAIPGCDRLELTQRAEPWQRNGTAFTGDHRQLTVLWRQPLPAWVLCNRWMEREALPPLETMFEHDWAFAGYGFAKRGEIAGGQNADMVERAVSTWAVDGVEQTPLLAFAPRACIKVGYPRGLETDNPYCPEHFYSTFRFNTDTQVMMVVVPLCVGPPTVAREGCELTPLERWNQELVSCSCDAAWILGEVGMARWEERDRRTGQFTRGFIVVVEYEMGDDNRRLTASSSIEQHGKAFVEDRVTSNGEKSDSDGDNGAPLSAEWLREQVESVRGQLQQAADNAHFKLVTCRPLDRTKAGLQSVDAVFQAAAAVAVLDVKTADVDDEDVADGGGGSGRGAPVNVQRRVESGKGSCCAVQ